MWRAFFLALGITSVILGAECTIVDKLFLVERSRTAPAAATGFKSPIAIPGFSSKSPDQPDTNVREFPIPEWAPWCLMSGGVVVILYSFTIPKRVGGG